MKAQAPFHLHVSRQGVVRDRNNLGTGPEGPILGWVRGRQGEWIATVPGGVPVASARTRYGALKLLFHFLKEGTDGN